MQQPIPNLISAILIRSFSNSFCIFFARITLFDIIISPLSLFSFNCYHCYFTIVLCLLIDDIVILDKLSQLIQVLFVSLGSPSGVSILHLLSKDTLILYNSPSRCYLKLQAFVFYVNLLSSKERAINVLVKNIKQKEPMSIGSNRGIDCIIPL